MIHKSAAINENFVQEKGTVNGYSRNLKNNEQTCESLTSKKKHRQGVGIFEKGVGIFDKKAEIIAKGSANEWKRKNGME